MSANLNALLNAAVVAINHTVTAVSGTTGTHAAAVQGTAAAASGAAAHGAASVAAGNVPAAAGSGTTAPQWLAPTFPVGIAPGTAGVPLASTQPVFGAGQFVVQPGLGILNHNAIRRTDSTADAMENKSNGQQISTRMGEAIDTPFTQHLPPLPPSVGPTEGSAASENSSIPFRGTQPAFPPGLRVPNIVAVARSDSTSERAEKRDNGNGRSAGKKGSSVGKRSAKGVPPPPSSLDHTLLYTLPSAFTRTRPPPPVVIPETLPLPHMVIPADLFAPTPTPATASTVTGAPAAGVAPSDADAVAAVADPGLSALHYHAIDARAAKSRRSLKWKGPGLQRSHRRHAHHMTPDDCQTLRRLAANRIEEDEMLVEEMLVEQDDILVEEDESLVQEDESMVEENESPVEDEKTLVDKYKTLVKEDASLIEAEARSVWNKNDQLTFLNDLRKAELAKPPHLRENFVTSAEVDLELQLNRVREARQLAAAQVAFVARDFFPEAPPVPAPRPQPPPPPRSLLSVMAGAVKGMFKRKRGADDVSSPSSAKRARVEQKPEPQPRFVFLRPLRVKPPPRPPRGQRSTRPEKLPYRGAAAFPLFYSTSDVAMQTDLVLESPAIAGKPFQPPSLPPSPADAGPPRQPEMAPPSPTPSPTGTTPPAPLTVPLKERHVHFDLFPSITRPPRSSSLPPRSTIGVEGRSNYCFDDGVQPLPAGYLHKQEWMMQAKSTLKRKARGLDNDATLDPTARQIWSHPNAQYAKYRDFSVQCDLPAPQDDGA